MELFKLVGVLFVVVGFILKWDTIATVVAAGIITGLVAMMNGTMTFIEIFETLGSSFVSQRTATLFGLTVGIIGICERYGLKDKAWILLKTQQAYHRRPAFRMADYPYPFRRIFSASGRPCAVHPPDYPADGGRRRLCEIRRN